MEQYLFYILFPIFFVLVWLLSVSLISVLSGWKNLTRKFPMPDFKSEKPKKVFRMQTMKLNDLIYYRMCMVIEVYENGILIRPIIFYSFLHKPIFVNFEQLKITKITGFFSKSNAVKLGPKNVYILNGAAYNYLKKNDAV